MNYSKYLLHIIVILSFLWVSSTSAQTKTYKTDIPNIPEPEKNNQQNLYHSMRMKRYNQLYRKHASDNNSDIPSQTNQKQETLKLNNTHNYNLPYYQEITKSTPSSEQGPVQKQTNPKHSRQKPSSRQQKYQKKYIKSHTYKNKRNSSNRLSKAKQNKRIQNKTRSITKPVHRDWRQLFAKTKPIPGFNISLAPKTKGPYKYYAPKFYRGIYITNGTTRSSKRYKRLLSRAKKHGVNVLVVDVQPRMPSLTFMKYARQQDFYLVSRVVVFPGGLKQYPPSKKHINRVAAKAKKSAKSGFMEVQLDYIRFTDYYKGPRLSRNQRYRTVATVIKHIADQVQPLGIKIGADIFGRIPFNKNDRIGQNMEVFALHLDTIYPMLYPSHFYGDSRMQKNPYLPVYQGTLKSVQRVGHNTKIIAYIQAFRMHTKKSKLSYQNYIYKQLKASYDAGGSGFIAWNAGNRYHTFFRAMTQFQKWQAKKELSNR